jgi:CRP-like cAMP-binding protein
MSLPEPECGFCGQPTDHPFCGLPEHVRDALISARTGYTFDVGEVLFYEGKPAMALYCLKQGRVKLYKAASKGETQVIRLLGPSDLAGFRAILAGEPYAATAEVIEETAACVIERNVLLDLLQNSPELAFKMMHKLAKELRISEEQTLSLRYDSVRRRVARLLLQLTESGSESDTEGKSLEAVRLARKEMAEIAATTPETLSRTLRLLARQKVIELSRTNLRIVDLKALHKIAAI